MSLNNEGVILLEQEMHLLDFLRGERLHNVELVVREIKFGATASGGIHGFGALGQRLQVRTVVDAEALAKITED